MLIPVGEVLHVYVIKEKFLAKYFYRTYIILNIWHVYS